MTEAKPKWFWIYTAPAKYEKGIHLGANEAHLFPPDLIPEKSIGTPALPLPKRSPCCNTELVSWTEYTGGWMLFNLGGADVMRMIRFAAGNDVVICEKCKVIEGEIAARAEQQPPTETEPTT